MKLAGGHRSMLSATTVGYPWHLSIDQLSAPQFQPRCQAARDANGPSQGPMNCRARSLVMKDVLKGMKGKSLGLHQRASVTGQGVIAGLPSWYCWILL